MSDLIFDEKALNNMVLGKIRRQAPISLPSQSSLKNLIKKLQKMQPPKVS